VNEPETRIARCSDGALEGRAYEFPLSTPDGTAHALEAVAVYWLHGSELRFGWPLLLKALFRGGPYDGQLVLADNTEVPATWSAVELDGREHEGTYRRDADGHFQWDASLVNWDGFDAELDELVAGSQ